MEAEITVPLGLSNDAAEGKAAFIEKRAPQFLCEVDAHSGAMQRLPGPGATWDSHLARVV